MHRTIRLFVVLATLAGLLVISAPAATAQPATHPANGVWEATDPVDGSDLTLLVFGRRDRVRIVLFDDEATVACPVNDSAAVAWGHGRWVANSVDLTVRIRCLGEPNPGPVPLNFTYDPATDTITSGVEVYSRV